MEKAISGIEFLRLAVAFEARDGGRYDNHPGAVFHGALGRALYETACGPRRTDCTGCLALDRCAYPPLFGELGDGRNRGADSRGRVAQGLVLVPPVGESWAAGSRLSLGIYLLGPAIKTLPYLLMALARMARGPIGRNSREGAFELSGINFLDAAGDPRLTWRDGDPLPAADNLPITMVCSLAPLDITDRVRVTFDTPLRLLVGKQPVGDMTFEALVRGMLRRVSGVLGPERSAGLAFRPWIERSRQVERAACHTTWVEAWRWSSRQGRLHPLHGWIGLADYAGEALQDFEPLLRSIVHLGLGKGTSFGQGRISIGLPPPARERGTQPS